MKKLLCGILLLSSATAFSDGAKDTKVELSKFLFENKEGINTDVFIVIQNGKTLYENYGRGFDKNKKHFSWSMAKTFGGILTGQAIDQGLLNSDDPIKKWIPKISSDATIMNVINMSSGIHFREEYAGVPINSDATQMLYLKGLKVGFAQYTASLPKNEEVKPGHYFYYSSGDANLLMQSLRNALADDQAYNEYPWKNIFNPLGIKSATFEQDSTGTFVGSSYVYMTPSDYIKIGQLLMNKGRVGKKQIIPEWYFEQMTKTAYGVQEKALIGTDPERSYSNQITTNLPITGRGLLSQYPDLPEDALIMIGHQGQLIIASPSQKLLILRLAMDKKDNIDRQELFSRVKKLLIETGHDVTVARDAHIEEYQHYIRPDHLKAPGTASLEEYLQVPRLIRALAAKEMCSCLLVEKRSMDQCKDDLKTMLPILPRFTVSETGVVKARLGLGNKSSTAKFVSENLGCTLIENN